MAVERVPVETLRYGDEIVVPQRHEMARVVEAAWVGADQVWLRLDWEAGTARSLQLPRGMSLQLPRGMRVERLVLPRWKRRGHVLLAKRGGRMASGGVTERPLVRGFEPPGPPMSDFPSASGARPSDAERAVYGWERLTSKPQDADRPTGSPRVDPPIIRPGAVLSEQQQRDIERRGTGLYGGHADQHAVPFAGAGDRRACPECGAEASIRETDGGGNSVVCWAVCPTHGVLGESWQIGGTCSLIRRHEMKRAAVRAHEEIVRLRARLEMVEDALRGKPGWGGLAIMVAGTLRRHREAGGYEEWR